MISAKIIPKKNSNNVEVAVANSLNTISDWFNLYLTCENTFGEAANFELRSAPFPTNNLSHPPGESSSMEEDSTIVITDNDTLVTEPTLQSNPSPTHKAHDTSDSTITSDNSISFDDEETLDESVVIPQRSRRRTVRQLVDEAQDVVALTNMLSVEAQKTSDKEAYKHAEGMLAGTTAMYEERSDGDVELEQ